MKALGQSRPIAIYTGIAAATNVALNLVLIPGTGAGGIDISALGILGAAVATVTSYLLRDVLIVGHLWRETGAVITDREVLTPITLSIPLFAGLAVLAPSLPGTLLWVVATSALFGILYLSVIVVTLGFQLEEVMLVRSAEEKYGIELGSVLAIIERFS